MSLAVSRIALGVNCCGVSRGDVGPPVELVLCKITQLSDARGIFHWRWSDSDVYAECACTMSM